MSQQKKLEISERVRAFRESRKISQEELGTLLGVSGNYIYLIESGKKSPGDSLLKLFETIEHSEGLLRDRPFDAENAPNPYEHLQIETLHKSLADLSAKLPTLPEQERKYVIGNIRAVLDELEQRELLKKSVNEVKETKVVYGSSRVLRRGSGTATPGKSAADQFAEEAEKESSGTHGKHAK